MPAPVEFTITMSALPVGFAGDPQELADAIADRLTITPSEPWSSFINGGAAPTSDEGPWLKLGQQWFVWDVGTGAYIPLVVDGAGIIPASITAAAFAPGAVDAGAITDGSLPISKLANDSAKGVLTYNASGVPTVSAAGSNGWVLTQSASGPIMAALPAFPTPTPFNAYIGTAKLNVSQAVTADNTPYKMTLDAAILNPASAFNIGSSRYIAPASGTYHLDVTSQFDNVSATAANVQVIVTVYKNGSPATEGIAMFDDTPSPNGGRWSTPFGGIIALNSGDYLECYATINDGVGTNTVNLTTWNFSVFRISA